MGDKPRLTPNQRMFRVIAKVLYEQADEEPALVQVPKTAVRGEGARNRPAAALVGAPASPTEGVATVRSLKFVFFALVFLSAFAIEAKADVVKKSSSGICHCPGGSFYDRTARFTPYKTLEACLRSGGRHPKRGQGDCSKAAPEPGSPATIKNKTRKIEGDPVLDGPPTPLRFENPPKPGGVWL